MHIAIIGCGQLARMLALAGIPMGLKFSFIAQAEEDSRCVEGLGSIVRWQPGKSTECLYHELGRPDRITAENEQANTSLLNGLQAYCPIHPNPQAFSICQDRHREKQLLESLDIPCADYIVCQGNDSHLDKLSLSAVAKSCRGGYDGKKQWVLKRRQDVESFMRQANREHYIVEQWVPFDREVSQISVRDINGTIFHYPLTENQHQQGILRQSMAPAIEIPEKIISAAHDYISRILAELDYVGVMAMECFALNDRLLVNELAPRVHNSGHWTQSGSATCQFENHLRAISELPLGSTKSLGITGMVNLIGTEKPPLNALTIESSLHWYDKIVRPGRKLGHINILSEDYHSLLQQMRSLHLGRG
ncbi:5-(carboxyamino)imidazole ribonucleotide synthase [Microbulbifer sp. TYP-18]|uniref:5-(carboxyamino)imidazole ribonucleotide synthase n=1 Tax=Microbulbifer sp. TYP-18 TaxID=3230024 RepID=UPI0034C6B887